MLYAPVSLPQAPSVDRPKDSPVLPGPYDRLELLASIAAEGDQSYLLAKVRARGLDFVADQHFLDVILRWRAHTDLIGAVEDARPKKNVTPSPERERAYEILADLHTSMRNPLATFQFRSAAELAPDSAALHLALATHLFWVKDYPSAEVEARKSIQLWPDNADAHTILAGILALEDRADSGISEARQALSIYPDDKTAVATLGLALWGERQYKEAIPVLRDGIARNPFVGVLHKDLGISLYNTGDIEGAISEYVIFLKAAPTDADGHYQLGVAFRAEGRDEDALAQFRECTRLDASNLVCSAAADPSSAAKALVEPEGQRPDDGKVDRNTYTSRFFGFSLQFPENWLPLSADAARAASGLGAAMISDNDRSIEDAARAGRAHAYPLLFVMPASGQGITSKAIQIQALDSAALGLTLTSGKDFLESSTRLYRKMHLPMRASGPPTEISVDGKSLWRLDLTLQVDNNTHYLSEIAMVRNGFLLLFFFSSPDQAGFNDLLQYVNTLRFFPDPN